MSLLLSATLQDHERVTADAFVDCLNGDYLVESGNFDSAKLSYIISPASKKFKTIAEFDMFISKISGCLRFQDCDDNDEAVGETKSLLDVDPNGSKEQQGIAMLVTMYRDVFRYLAYQEIFDQQYHELDIETLLNSRYVFEDEDIQAEYTNLDTALVRVCGRLRNSRLHIDDGSASLDRFAENFRNLLMLQTRIRSFSYIADSVETR